ncbi:MAG TPA: HEAT repeat domain-containing protein, partial [Spirochaetota bacterium]|nr:HEAT repeat domain-containing protein [Spirochaetota bacterium]
ERRAASAGRCGGHAEQQAPDAGDVVARLLSNEKDTSKGAYDYIAKYRPMDVAVKMGDVLVVGGDSEEKEKILTLLRQYPFKSVKDIYLKVLDRTSSFFVKKEVISVLGNAGDREFVIPIAKELESPFSVVREKAIFYLRSIGDDRMFPYIVKLSENKDPVFRVYALEALTSLYDFRLLNVVQSLLQDENKSVRILAIQCVQKNSIDKLFPVIRTLAGSDPDNEVRIEAITAIGKLNDTGALSVLLKTINNEAVEIRLSTVQVLYKMRMKQSLRSVSDRLAVESDNQIKNICIDIMIEMKDGGGLRGLEREVMFEEYLPLRIKSVYALGIVGGPKVSGILVKALNDKDYKVRAEACGALSGNKDKAVLNALLAVIKSDNERYVRLAALYAIEKTRDKSTIIPLFDMYSSEKDPIFRFKLYEVTRNLIQTAL